MNVGNLVGNAGNLMQGNLASSCPNGGIPPGMCPGVGLNPSPSWNGMATNPVLPVNSCGNEARQFGPCVGGMTPQVATYQEILLLLPQLGTQQFSMLQQLVNTGSQAQMRGVPEVEDVKGLRGMILPSPEPGILVCLAVKAIGVLLTFLQKAKNG